MLVSVHDIFLAKNYSDRIVGLQGGEKIFDRPTRAIETEELDQIYHEAG
jgi:phosphonate transport system ATP-binding protein